MLQEPGFCSRSRVGTPIGCELLYEDAELPLETDITSGQNIDQRILRIVKGNNMEKSVNKFVEMHFAGMQGRRGPGSS